jgi:hypothetical protein
MPEFPIRHFFSPCPALAFTIWFSPSLRTLTKKQTGKKKAL